MHPLPGGCEIVNRPGGLSMVADHPPIYEVELGAVG